MTSSVRFINFFNNTGVAITSPSSAAIPSGDGDDKKIMVIQRAIKTGDIGPGVGQSKDPTTGGGIILYTLKPGDNVVCMTWSTYREDQSKAYLLDNRSILSSGAIVASTFSIQISPDRTIRLLDTTAAGGIFLDNGDFIVLTLILGTGIAWET